MIKNKIPRRLPCSDRLTALVDPRNSKCVGGANPGTFVYDAISGMRGDVSHIDVKKFAEAGYFDFGSAAPSVTNLKGREYTLQSNFEGNAWMSFPHEFGGDAFSNPDKGYEGTFMIWFWVPPNNDTDDYIETYPGVQTGEYITWLAGSQIERSGDTDVFAPILTLNPMSSTRAGDLIESQTKTLYGFDFAPNNISQRIYDSTPTSVNGFYNNVRTRFPNINSHSPELVKGRWQCIVFKAKSFTGEHNDAAPEYSYNFDQAPPFLTENMRGVMYSCYHNGKPHNPNAANRTVWGDETSRFDELRDDNKKIKFNAFGSGPIRFTTGTYSDNNITDTDGVIDGIPRAFRGRIGLIAIWDKGLSDKEIEQAYTTYKDYYIDTPKFEYDGPLFIGIDDTTSANDTLLTINETLPAMDEYSLPQVASFIPKIQQLNAEVQLEIENTDDYDKFTLTRTSGSDIVSVDILEDYDSTIKSLYKLNLLAKVNDIPDLNTDDYLEAINYQHSLGGTRDIADYVRSVTPIPLTFYSVSFLDDAGNVLTQDEEIDTLTQQQLIQKTKANNDSVYTARTNLSNQLDGVQIYYSIGTTQQSSTYFEIDQDGNVYWAGDPNFVGTTTWLIDIRATILGAAGQTYQHKVYVDPIPTSDIFLPSRGNTYDSAYEYNELIARDFSGCTASTLPDKAFNYLTDKFYDIEGINTNFFELVPSTHGVHNQYFEINKAKGELFIDHQPNPTLLSAYDVTIRATEFEQRKISSNTSTQPDSGEYYEIVHLGEDVPNNPRTVQDVWNDIVGTTGITYSVGSTFYLTNGLSVENIAYFSGQHANPPVLNLLNNQFSRIETAQATTVDIRFIVQCVRQSTITPANDLQDVTTASGTVGTFTFTPEIINSPNGQFRVYWEYNILSNTALGAVTQLPTDTWIGFSQVWYNVGSTPEFPIYAQSVYDGIQFRARIVEPENLVGDTTTRAATLNVPI